MNLWAGARSSSWRSRPERCSPGRLPTPGERATCQGVLGACETLLDRRTREPFGIAALLAGYVSRVRVAQAVSEEGLGSAEVAKRLKMKEYPARKLISFARNYTREELDAAVVRLAELDAALKGASRLPAELELERALVEITAPRVGAPA